jgi:hypothetical protein
MKKLFYYAIIVIGIGMMSCAKDEKTNPPITPSTDARDGYVANWSASEISTTSGTPNSYTVNITKSSTISIGIIIENFYGLSGYTVSATVSGNTFTIPYQTIKNNTNSAIGFASGSGTLTNASKINLTYTTSITGNRDSCTTVYTK